MQVEQGSRNHEIVPTPLITSISGLHNRTGVHKHISTLAKLNLISRVRNAKYDGYRLTYGGLDYLALHAHLKSQCIYSVGNQVGVGKESDIFVVAAPTGEKLVLKIHRLGRISFRTVKTNRDYLRNRSSGSWMYMSRLAAMKEHAFLQALYDVGFPVPKPAAWNRHTVLMALIDAFPLRQITKVPDPASLYGQLIELILRLAKFGLIHGDFNEFNILIEENEFESSPEAQLGNPTPDGSRSTSSETQPETAPEEASLAAPPEPIPDLLSTPAEQLQPSNSEPKSRHTIKLNPIIIDFPQSVSIDHPNAEFYFNRDVNCVKRFFSRRFGFTSDEPGPFFADAMQDVGKRPGIRRLDVEVEASGFSRKMAKELEKYMKEVGVDGDAKTSGSGEQDAANEDESSEDEGDVEGLATEDDGAESIPPPLEESGVLLPLATHVVDGMTVMELSEAAASRPNFPADPHRDEAFSMAGSVRSVRSRNPTTIAKASKGWAI